MSKAGSSKKISKEPPAKKSRVDDGSSSKSSAKVTADLPHDGAIESKKITTAAKSVADFKFNKKRCRLLSKTMELADNRGGGVLYWMSRDQRVQGLKNENIKKINRKII